MHLIQHQQKQINEIYYQDKSINDDNKLIYLFLRNQESPNTYKTYQRAIKQYLYYINKPLGQIPVSDIQDYIDYIKNKYKGTSANTYINAISSLYSFGIKLGYLKFNPFTVVKKPKATNSKAIKRILNYKEIELLLNEMKKKKRNAAIGALLITVGMRVSELCNIKWKNFYKDINGNIGLHIIGGKGDKNRDVKIRKDVWKHIIEYRKSINKKTDIDDKDDGYLFITRNNKRIDERYVRWIIANACKKVGIDKKVSPHWFRHTSASISLQNGANIAKVTENYGWSSLKTASIYLHNIDKLNDTSVDYVDVEL